MPLPTHFTRVIRSQAEKEKRRRSYGLTVAKSVENGEQPESLLRSLVQGDSAAFWQLWEGYRNDLYHICLWQMKGTREEAEDALSGAMLKAWEKLPTHAEQITNLRAWLIRLTCNLCVDLHRERRRRSWSDSPAVGAGLAADKPQANRHDSPEEALLQREAVSRLHMAIRDLPLHLRQPFELRFFHEAEYLEIAHTLSLSPSNVRKRIQMARAILRGRLDPTASVPNDNRLRRLL